MNRQSRMPLILAIVLLLLPALFVGSYLALVKPTVAGDWFEEPYADYRIGGKVAAAVFWPLEQVDRKVRPRAWEEPVIYSAEQWRRITVPPSRP